MHLYKIHMLCDCFGRIADVGALKATRAEHSLLSMNLVWNSLFLFYCFVFVHQMYKAKWTLKAAKFDALALICYMAVRWMFLCSSVYRGATAVFMLYLWRIWATFLCRFCHNFSDVFSAPEKVLSFVFVYLFIYFC